MIREVQRKKFREVQRKCTLGSQSGVADPAEPGVARAEEARDGQHGGGHAADRGEDAAPRPQPAEEHLLDE